MNTDILIVSCEKHFPWLRWALKSMVRFASGFRQIVVLIPESDMHGLNSWLGEFSNHQGVPIRFMMYKDWPNKGFLCHEWQIIQSDTYTDAEFICHMDSDCLFVEPVTPADYFVDNKPVLMYASYDWLANDVQANLRMWQETVRRAIGGKVQYETMRRHPAVHHREVYGLTRECMEKHLHKDPMEYVKSCENGFPQTFCEFNTLGTVAWRHLHPKYHWIDHEYLHKTNTPWPNSKIAQFWSHGDVNNPQAPHYKGKPFECTPEKLYNLCASG